MTSNEELSAFFYVKDSEIHGQGLFAKQKIPKGTYLGQYHGPKVKKDGMHVLWVEENAGKWVGYDGKNLLRYLNHNKKPNAEFDGRKLFAARSIKPGQEVTIHYGEESGLD